MVMVFSLTTASASPSAQEEPGLLPIRTIFEEAGGVVRWNSEDRSIHITTAGYDYIILFVGRQNAYINAQNIYLGSEIAILQNRTFITAEDLFLITSVVEAQAATARTGTITGALHRIVYGYNVVYLFGSLHAERAGWFPLSYMVEAAMRRADVFVFEVDFTDEEAIFAALSNVMILPEGLTLDKLLTPDEIEGYLAALLTFGFTNEHFAYVNYENPVYIRWVIIQSIMMALTDNIEMSFTQSVDAYVLNFASTQGLPIAFLETMEQQLHLMHMPPVDVIAHVARTFPTADEVLESFAQGEAAGLTLDDLANAYEINDFEALANMFAVEFANVDDDIFLKHQRDKLHNFRSTYYAYGILSLLRETEEPTTFFVTVGAYHIIRSMAGEEFTDIVEQLALRGVEAVPLF